MEQEKNLLPNKEKKSIWHKRKHKLREYLEKAGISIPEEKITGKLVYTTIFINLAISFYLIYLFSNKFRITWETIGISISAVWVLLFILIISILWTIVYTILDLRIYQRKLELEEVLPDFLQLTASNIKTGMPVDKALWYAVRPKFGVLAKEIELVAKETMSGVELKDSLFKFALKYDSVILKRSMNMLIEGIEAGGKIGDLLDKIANNIKEHKIMVKEIAASVTTYTIFITFAAIIAAPVLFALSGSLIVVIKSLGATLSGVSGGASSVLPISFGIGGVDIGHFKIFAVVSLILSSTFSAMIIAIIRKGNVRSGIEYIPLFIFISLALYYISIKSSDFLLNIVFVVR